MHLSWNEVRARAAAFAEDWKDVAYRKGETQRFCDAFFDVFGVRQRNVARYEAHVAKLDNRSGFIDLFWPGVLIVEQKSTPSLSSSHSEDGRCLNDVGREDMSCAPTSPMEMTTPCGTPTGCSRTWRLCIGR